MTSATRLGIVAAIGLVVWAGVSIVASRNATPAREALFIEEPEQDVGQHPPGAHIITFRVRNTSQQPQRIIGMADG